MINQVRINNKMYLLDTKDGKGGTSTGVVYHLCRDEVDLAVKLYLDKEDSDGVIYPDLDDLKAFCRISSEVLPVLLSRFPTYDEKGNYNGCCTPFLYETRGNTLDLLYTLPKEEVIASLYALSKVVDKFTDLGIELEDWAVYNLRFGENPAYQLPFSLYMIDDSYYEFSEEDSQVLHSLNRTEMNHLIASLVEEYFYYHRSRTSSFRLTPNELRYLERYEDSFDPVGLLEQDCREFDTLGECFSQVILEKADFKVKKTCYNNFKI